MSHARSWLRQRFKKAPLIPKIDDQEDVPKQDAAHQAVARTMRRLCSACQRICGSNVGSLKDPENDTHHATASDCKRAVRSGCPVCAVVWRHATADGTVDVTSLKLKAAFSTWSVSTNGERDAHQRHRHWPEDTVTLTISTGSVSVAQGLGPMHIFANDNVDFALVETSQRREDVLSRTYAANTGSDSTWMQIETWLNTCVDEHHCTNRAVAYHSELPSRLIDVGQNAVDKFRITSNSEQACLMPYVALSHCWGGKSALVLYDHTRKRGPAKDWISLDQPEIAVARLPRTFRDAVDACRRLKVRWLWIDSLCIVQNSVEDWEQESKKMWSIYGSAFCTLAADGAANSEGGLFHERDDSLVQPLIVQPHWQQLQGRAPSALIHSELWKDNVAESLLGKRGWTLQERFLSPAVIHFHRNQVFWECRAVECCETYPLGVPHYATDSGARFKSTSAENSRILRSAFASDGNNDHEAGDGSLDRYYLWSRLIEKYTRMSLSYDKDRLIAIYGLGQYFQYVLRDSLDSETGIYVAGMWMDILPSQLIWTIEDNRTVAIVNADDVSRNSPVPLGRRPSDGRNAPSWSWASVVGPVVMPKPLRTGSLVELRLDGPNVNNLAKGKTSAGTFLRDMENTFGSHQQMMLRVTAGRLHLGRVMYNPMFDMWMLMMHPEGYPFQHNPSMASDRDRSDVVRSASQTHQGDSTKSRTLMELMLEKLRSPPSDKLEELALGIAQFDAREDVTSRDVMPIVCLPVINTRKCGKRALRQDVNFSLDGVSGLLLIPAGWDYPGFYQRIGAFHLLEGASNKLSDTSDDPRTYKDIFLPYDAHTIRLV